jgi:hypothetical protein
VGSTPIPFRQLSSALSKVSFGLKKRRVVPQIHTTKTKNNVTFQNSTALSAFNAVLFGDLNLQIR